MKAPWLCVVPTMLCTLLSVPSLGQAAWYPFEGCGTLAQGVECVFFQPDEYPHLELHIGNLGGFHVGDHVWASGEIDPYSISICMEGDGCIYVGVIRSCAVPVGACCFEDGHCEFLTEEQCLAAPGQVSWLGDGVACEPQNPCPQPGACCDLDSGECLFVLERFCEWPLVFFGGPCEPISPCPANHAGACCFMDGRCRVLLEYDCWVVGGFLWLYLEDCVDDCPPVPAEKMTWGRVKAIHR